MAVLPPIHRWDRVGRPRAAIHVVHGMVEHGGRYARLAAALNQAGFIVWAHDHRGHGINPVPGLAGHFADTAGWRAVVDDTWAVSSAMRATFPNLPLVLFAHSMGSFVGQTLMGEQGAAYRGVVLSGSNGAPGVQEGVARFAARVQRRTLGARAPGTWLTRLVIGTYNRHFAPNRTPHDWLSRDDAEVDAYQADPLNRFQLTSQAWLDFLDGKASLASRGQVARIPKDLPIYLMSGDRDPVGEQGGGVRRLIQAYERGGLTRVTLRLYEDARHELVNEIIRDEATANLVGWIEGIWRCGPWRGRPSHGTGRGRPAGPVVRSPGGMTDAY